MKALMLAAAVALAAPLGFIPIVSANDTQALAPAVAPLDEPTTQPTLTAEEVESGQVNLQDVSAERLEAFLQDLNRRKDYDYSQHDGQPGPDAEYLWKWVQRTMKELQSRGYSSDDAGDFHRPDGSVCPVR